MTPLFDINFSLIYVVLRMCICACLFAEGGSGSPSIHMSLRTISHISNTEDDQKK